MENNVAAANSDTLTQVATANYSRLNLQLRNLQKSISQSNARQKKNRTLYAALQNRIAENTSDTLLMSRRKDSLATLTQKITEEERNTLDLQENANKTASALKKIEDDFPVKRHNSSIYKTNRHVCQFRIKQGNTNDFQ